MITCFTIARSQAWVLSSTISSGLGLVEVKVSLLVTQPLNSTDSNDVTEVAAAGKAS